MGLLLVITGEVVVPSSPTIDNRVGHMSLIKLHYFFGLVYSPNPFDARIIYPLIHLNFHS